ncbi:hypothetical protein BDZ85DRAFT_252438 [Elsinoe ampelina]|uniref:NB-ARC domain-containing protein n=1 Tax=Elsinoe ampelina TaxID=302913 RepID=A0A6A6G348_9PEZI|nr:hypothetical protein BDZ85DRAFT_252438 [Elsinoe ampelina]
MGKSELCLQVTNALRKRFWGVFWIDVDNELQAKAHLLKVARRIGSEVETIDDAMEQINEISEPFLLVLDNADDIKMDYQRYLPTSCLGTVLMTSRNIECRKFATVNNHIVLDRLVHPDDEELLRKTIQTNALMTRQLVSEELTEVCELLAGHALAIVQAGSYIAHGCSLPQYVQEFKRQRKRLMEFHEEQARSRYGNVFSTFEVAAQRLTNSAAANDQDAYELLQILGVLDWKALPLSTFLAADRCMSLFEEGRRHETWDLLKLWHIQQIPAWVTHPSRVSTTFNHEGACTAEDHSSSVLPVVIGSNSQSPLHVSRNNRLLQAVSTLHKLALLMLVYDETDASVTLHPLVHAWARDRQSATRRDKSWITAGCILSSLLLDPTYIRAESTALKSHAISLMADIPCLSSSGEILRIAVMCCFIMVRLELHIEAMAPTQHLVSKLPAVENQPKEARWALLCIHAAAYQFAGEHEHVIATLLPLIEAMGKSSGSKARLAHATLYCSHSMRQLWRLNEARDLVEPFLRSLNEGEVQAGIEVYPRVKAEMANILGCLSRYDEAIALMLSVVNEEAAGREAHDRHLLSLRESLAMTYAVARRPEEEIAQRKIIFVTRTQHESETSYWRLIAGLHLATAYNMNRQPWLAFRILADIQDAVKKSWRSWTDVHLDHALQSGLALLFMSEPALALQQVEPVYQFYRTRLKKSDALRIKTENLISNIYWELGRKREAIKMLSQVVEHQDESGMSISRPWCVGNQKRLGGWKEEVARLDGSSDAKIDDVDDNKLEKTQQDQTTTEPQTADDVSQTQSISCQADVPGPPSATMGSGQEGDFVQETTTEADRATAGMQEATAGLEEISLKPS